MVDGDTVEVKAAGFFPTTILKRNGNAYSAVVELLDGGFNTFWPDYRNWFVQLVDTNDSDGDGIENLQLEKLDVFLYRPQESKSNPTEKGGKA